MVQKLSHAPLQACDECGLVSQISPIKAGYKAQCPRCDHTLIARPRGIFQSIQAYGVSILVMLTLSCSFPFMSFNLQGLSQQVTLFDALISLHYYQNTLLTVLLLLCVLLLPLLYTLSLMYIYKQIANKHAGKEVALGPLKLLCRYIFRVKPWLMADVFLVGILVAMVKIVSLADLWLGPSFWAFCLYSLFVIKFSSLINSAWIWEQLEPRQVIDGVSVGDSHMDENHITCYVCHQLNPIARHKQPCLRCQTQLHRYDPRASLQKAWALLIAAMMLYVPANLYPIMYTTSVGQTETSTIMSGVMLLWHLKSYPVAMVIFFASIMIPLSKIIILIYLLRYAQTPTTHDRQRARKNITLYRITEFIGRWSMIDIFVVSLLAALVQLDQLMSIEPGQAALSFAAVVILTMLSAQVFDSRMLWQRRNAPLQAPCASMQPVVSEISR